MINKFKKVVEYAEHIDIAHSMITGTFNIGRDKYNFEHVVELEELDLTCIEIEDTIELSRIIFTVSEQLKELEHFNTLVLNTVLNSGRMF